ncbi:hypothetical protein SEA_POPPER_43 [Arthrobacter phage Popper]|uniref:Uncharacterized protein n=1 Tax=Arthrobacter phage Popper TaxID=2859633 RepID=A0AAE7WDS4_9CAUD|nr:hypothetical protein QEO78_gp63 [Arthrobacter phage Popper]QYC54960.1 hypothetical protein SEA_POPPER_43 [Arthrobacter phage Popper]
MDASRSQGALVTELPRSLYFGAVDWLAAKPGITEQDLAQVRNQRHGLVAHVTNKAEKLIAAARTLRDFDTTGNAGAALDHLEAIRDDLFKITTNLINEVEDAEARYEKHSALPTEETPAAVVEPSPQQVPTAAGPTTQPVHNHGPEDGAGLSCREARTDAGPRGACLDEAPKVTPLTLVQNHAFSIISAGLDEAQRNRQLKAVRR